MEVKAEKNEKREEIQINILEVLKDMARKWWIILIAAVCGALALFMYQYITTDQQYTSTVELYVNNSSISSIADELSSITTGDVSASRSLTASYAVILKTHDTLDLVVEKLATLEDKDGKHPLHREYTYDDLLDMITVGAVNNTEVISIKVTGTDKEDVIWIADTILDVFPGRVSNIITGSSAKIVEHAHESVPISRGFTKMALIGFAVGLVLAVVVIFVLDFYINDTIRSTEYLKQAIPDDIPLLAIVPDTDEASNHKYGSYYRKSNYYYYSNGERHHSADTKESAKEDND